MWVYTLLKRYLQLSTFVKIEHKFFFEQEENKNTEKRRKLKFVERIDKQRLVHNNKNGWTD